MGRDMTHKRHFKPTPPPSSDALEKEELITLKEAAELSGFSIPYLRTISQVGRLRAIKKAGSWVTSLAAIEEYKNTRYIIIKKVQP